MGLGPPVIALYLQLKKLGAFEGVHSVIELGSQNVWCPHRTLVCRLFDAYGRAPPPDSLLNSFENWTGSARELYEALGMTYQCVDTDGRFGALVLDINRSAVPSEYKGKYDLTTNHGTTEHLINQLNAFQMIHDFTRPGGLILHALPFLGSFDHGFFSYHPNFFDAVARYNSYETLGVWLGVDWQQASFIPWHPGLLDIISLSPKTTGLLVVLHRKRFDTEFCIPFQGVYETTKTDDISANYCFVVDGDYYDGRRERFITRAQITEEYIQEQVTLRLQAQPKPIAPAGQITEEDIQEQRNTEEYIQEQVTLRLQAQPKPPAPAGQIVENTRTADLAKIVVGRIAQRLGAGRLISWPPAGGGKEKNE